LTPRVAKYFPTRSRLSRACLFVIFSDGILAPSSYSGYRRNIVSVDGSNDRVLQPISNARTTRARDSNQTPPHVRVKEAWR
jgi:hypothetical protein